MKTKKRRVWDTNSFAEELYRLSEDNTESIPLKDVLVEERYAEFLRTSIDDNDGWE